MSEIGFKIEVLPQPLSDEEREALRQHYLVYAKAERDEHRSLHKDLDTIYSQIDALSENGDILRLVSTMNQSAHTVVFATDASTLALREFQQAMLAEGKTIRLVSESSSEINSVRAMMPSDLLIVVTTSNGFARRQQKRIEASMAYKAIVTANSDPELHSHFNQVLQLGDSAREGSALHRIFATFGVTYFFDRFFTQYARAYDPQLK
ncbi:MAG: hypothetical protein DUD39_08690 [Coriobacteriaceae bacterium]|jgi:DNA-binding MurR/RpiR family transcriptional regulator|uniref:hypothetical protein n=1 Tax=Atopobium sp. oral taxon 416 TaxID=712157 RepID=UPI000FF7C9D8|nr:hypothetical protein [Atopobium sp. oral taxon 416]QUC03913.1 hypothetical protein J4859_02880 [Atopobium sp. oral taxon 416]RRF98610.1 MAG: hypothetical protein DUD39_08690 [Coriobacteriaceae bacterium]